MEERGISRLDIEQALAHQIETMPGQPGSIWIKGYAAGGRILKVCVNIHDHSQVITAAWPGNNG